MFLNVNSINLDTYFVILMMTLTLLEQWIEALSPTSFETSNDVARSSYLRQANTQE